LRIEPMLEVRPEVVDVPLQWLALRRFREARYLDVDLRLSSVVRAKLHGIAGPGPRHRRQPAAVPGLSPHARTIACRPVGDYITAGQTSLSHVAIGAGGTHFIFAEGWLADREDRGKFND
jgi:hypothetical protein